MRFTVTVQDPFEQQERVSSAISADEALQLFQQMDWEGLEKAIYERLDEVIHHFYFYEISQQAYGDKRTLTISPGFERQGEMLSKRRIYMVRYEYPHPTNTGQYLDYSYQQCDYAFAQESLQAFVQGNRPFFADQFETPGNKSLGRRKLFKKLLGIFAGLLVALLLFIHFVIGWNHVPEPWASLQSLLFTRSDNDDQAAEGAVAAGMSTLADTTRVAAAPEVLCDTVMWKAAIARGDYIPDAVQEAYERARDFDYSTLQPATNRPTSAEAQEAILHYYKEQVGQLLKEHKAYIRIGKAYKAPLQPDDTNGGETARVTAMIAAFNQQGDNLGNIQMPLEIAYDFVQYAADPGVWYLADLSQTIPYDYVLMKDR